MKINRSQAQAILEEEAASDAPTLPEWEELVEQLSRAVDNGSNGTFIAMLGTALLARATDLRANPFALKAGLDSTGAYSARGLCQHVLAAHAPRLNIDLGVTGREPLNNQPFFAESIVHKGLPVHARASAGFDILLGCLQRISEFDDITVARAALRSFLNIRRDQRYAGNFQLADDVPIPDLLKIADEYVSGNSENGKRAQAVVAGLLNTIGIGSVVTSKIHDPDKNWPGDVNIIVGGAMTHAFEVRDKPVSESDLYHFIVKVAEADGRHAAVVAIGTGQSHFDLDEVVIFGQERNVAIHVFLSWADLLYSAILWTLTPILGLGTKALRAIHKRSIELEVSESGIRFLEGTERL